MLDEQQQVNSFLDTWPIERLKAMTLEEYTNLDRDSSFTYWLEKKTERAGSIWGGSSFKFGIYKRRNTEKFVEKPMVKTDSEYAWLSKYGSSKEVAFKSVKEIIINLAQLSDNGQFREIDDIDLGDAVKWKIAFLYNSDNLIPIFNRKVLELAAEANGLNNHRKYSISELQSHIIGKKDAGKSSLEFAKELWGKFNPNNFYPIIEKFVSQAQTDDLKKRGYPTNYKDLDVKVSFGAGNTARIPWIAFLREPNTVTDGIYPVYLYYKKDNILVLAYGLSETNEPRTKWANESELQTINDWFLKNKGFKPERYGNSFIKGIYDLNDNIDSDIVQAELDSIIDTYSNLVSESSEKISSTESENKVTRTWLIAPGDNAYLWDEFYSNGLIGIGWDYMGDLSQFSSREEIREAIMQRSANKDSSQTNNSLCLWQFSREIKVGDIIIPKRGRSEYLGYGIVAGGYYYDESRSDYKHLIKVDWRKNGVWEEKSGQIVLKTLTDITKYPEYVDRLKRLIGIEQEATVDVNKIEYYWININPKYWKIEDLQVGQEQSYSIQNEAGGKRNKIENFKQIKSGDLVIGFEAGPIQKIVAIFEITFGVHFDEDTGLEVITFKVLKFLPTSISYAVLKSMPELKNSPVLSNAQGSLLKLKKEEYDSIVDLDITSEIEISPYTIKDAEKEIFLEKEALEKVIDAIEYKKNIILQGPPGVGKTFMAKRLAYLIMEEKDAAKVEMIQFHQSYSYEDFMQGYRPKDNGAFRLENGIFFRFCKRAQADPDNKYFFIIDEINRGNLSKIFGELMLLIEADKRGFENAVSLTYTAAGENRFFIPTNVYLIGTMNTADRSLAVVDYALRRRFAFISVDPCFNNKFRDELINLGVDEGIINPIISKITSLNAAIENDLGKGFNIGHSYFCNVPKNTGDEEWYHSIIEHEIAPIISEYWYDNEEKAKLEIKRLYLK